MLAATTGIGDARPQAQRGHLLDTAGINVVNLKNEKILGHPDHHQVESPGVHREERARQDD
eukprot:14469425-Heterocapsa_arctica.AAC.1